MPADLDAAKYVSFTTYKKNGVVISSIVLASVVENSFRKP